MPETTQTERFKPKLTHKIALAFVVLLVLFCFVIIGMMTGGLYDILFIIMIIGAIPLKWKLVGVSIAALLAALAWKTKETEETEQD